MTAACQGLPIDLFAATEQECLTRSVQRDYSVARSYCESCPVRRDCTSAGLDFGDRHTVRGGYLFWLPEHRDAARRNQPPPPIPTDQEVTPHEQ